MADLTPLSITHQLPRFKRKGRSFEENIQDGALRIEELEPRDPAPQRKRKHMMPMSSIIPRQLSPKIQALMPGLLEYTGSKTNKSCSASVSVESTSSPLSFPTFDGPNPGAKKGQSHLPSSDLNSISNKALAELDEISSKVYRISGQASDADDERDASDIETLLGYDDELEDTDTLENQENIPPGGVDQDDQGLSTGLRDGLSINGMRGHISNRSNSDENRSIEGGISIVVLKERETKRRELPLISPLLFSVTAEEADEEDNAATPTKAARSERSKR